ncbi:MAG TPA: FHA domain-containing protein [Solirubrobacteraceae bacterium]|nr:FHA domain-containing protein [Solirubrobacteraceae bacterium]
MALHCPECGFVNDESANYCQKCGAYLHPGEEAEDSTTMTYAIDETGELKPVDLDEVTSQGAALVIRAGGGRVGESFALSGDRLSIGRRPDADIFLDDVTVSRDHALLIRRADGYHLDDCGSLNGTYVNRRRVESVRLEDGDELQIGKYKLSFLTR